MPPKLTDADYQRLLELRSGLRLFLHWSEQQAASADLTPAQHQLLLAIRGHPDPRGPTIGAKRIHRGGSWKSRFSSLRTTVRGSNVPSFSCNDLGFRIVCECD